MAEKRGRGLLVGVGNAKGKAGSGFMALSCLYHSLTQLRA